MIKGKKIVVVAITKQGIMIAQRIKEKMPEVDVYVPLKFKDSSIPYIKWFTEQTNELIANLFRNSSALICIFSLGAVIRLIAPFLVDKKVDPAVIVIDDKANFVISTLSGHLGGANNLTRLISSFFSNSQPVITTAADVHETIAVDLVGREFGWSIENDDNVTKVSAFMVNGESMALYQETGENNWWHKQSLPKNIMKVSNLNEVKSPNFKGALIISDRIINDPDILKKSVIFRPKSLVVGVGLHWDTSKDIIEHGIQRVMREKGLSFKCIRNISSISREGKVKGLQEFSAEHKIPIEIYDKDKLDNIKVPNPSETVRRFEGTPSVSESSSILSSKGELIVAKQKFPPNLTVAVSRVTFGNE